MQAFRTQDHCVFPEAQIPFCCNLPVSQTSLDPVYDHTSEGTCKLKDDMLVSRRETVPNAWNSLFSQSLLDAKEDSAAEGASVLSGETSDENHHVAAKSQQTTQALQTQEHYPALCPQENTFEAANKYAQTCDPKTQTTMTATVRVQSPPFVRR